MLWLNYNHSFWKVKDIESRKTARGWGEKSTCCAGVKTWVRFPYTHVKSCGCYCVPWTACVTAGGRKGSILGLSDSDYSVEKVFKGNKMKMDRTKLPTSTFGLVSLQAFTRHVRLFSVFDFVLFCCFSFCQFDTSWHYLARRTSLEKISQADSLQASVRGHFLDQWLKEEGPCFCEWCHC